jgi:hypothetical protein
MNRETMKGSNVKQVMLKRVLAGRVNEEGKVG